MPTRAGGRWVGKACAGALSGAITADFAFAYGRRGDPLHMLNMLASSESSLLECAVQMEAAHILAAPLQERGFHRQFQRLAHKGRIALKKLIL